MPRSQRESGAIDGAEPFKHGGGVGDHLGVVHPGQPSGELAAPEGLAANPVDGVVDVGPGNVLAQPARVRGRDMIITPRDRQPGSVLDDTDRLGGEVDGVLHRLVHPPHRAGVPTLRTPTGVAEPDRVERADRSVVEIELDHRPVVPDAQDRGGPTHHDMLGLGVLRSRVRGDGRRPRELGAHRRQVPDGRSASRATTGPGR